MTYQEFKGELEALLRSQAPEGTRISIHQVLKNHAVVHDCLSILPRGERASPAIYLEPFFEKYEEGAGLEEIAAHLWSSWERSRRTLDFDPAFYTCWEQVKGRIVWRLVSQKGNQEMLRKVPHRLFLDLALTYYCIADAPRPGGAFILVKREHLKLWKVSEEQIEEAAARNTPVWMPPLWMGMGTMLKRLTGDECPAPEGELLYVLTNKEQCYGAVWMSDLKLLHGIGEKLQEDFFVLPSSVHECMIVPVSVHKDARLLGEMVAQINRTVVEPEDVLCDTVYVYSRQSRTLDVADDRLASAPERGDGQEVKGRLEISPEGHRV